MIQSIPSPDVGIIIPIYNNLHVFEKAHPYLKEVLLLCVDTNIKVTLVDDGSRDSKKVEAFAKANNYNYLLISPNKGKGNAIREAAKSIDYEYFIFTDADIPFSVKTMTLLIKTITEKKFNFIIGDRSLEESSYFFKIPVKRNILSKVFTFIVNKFISYGLNDTQCGIKGFKTSLFNEISEKTKTNRFTFDAEIIHIAKKNNIPIKRIPVDLRDNQNESSVRLINDSFIMFFDLIKIKTRSIFGMYQIKQ